MNGINPDAPQGVTDVNINPPSNAEPMPGPADHSNYDPQQLAHDNVVRDIPGQGMEHPAVQEAAAQPAANPQAPSREYALSSVFTGSAFVIGGIKLSDVQPDGTTTIQNGISYTDLEIAYSDLKIIERHLVQTMISRAFTLGQESNATPTSTPDTPASQEAQG